MDKSLGQLLIGAILGAVGVEVLREKKPELFDELKKNITNIAKDFKSIHNQINTAVKDWASNTS